MRIITTLKENIVTEFRSIDRGILYSALLLMFFGFFLTFAAGPAAAIRHKESLEWTYFVYKNLAFMPIGLVVLLLVALFPVPWARRVGFLAFVCAIFGMILVLIIGRGDSHGAARWISIAGVSVQPSEFVKPAFAVVCGWLLARGKLIHAFHGYIFSWVLMGITVLLLFKQPDFGMILTIFGIFAVELFMTGISMKCIMSLVGLGIALLTAGYLCLNHVYTRINKFFNPNEEVGYQVRKSLETLKNAGWFGKGPGEGIVKYDLPDAHTDFIMAVSAEEFGFLLSAIIVMTFMYIVFKGTKLVRQSNNYFVQLAVGGLVTQIACQAIVNMASTLNLIPTKGMTLPLISYGGSSLVSMAFAFGLILAFTKRQTFSRGLE